MAEYFGFEIEEREDGEVDGLLDGVDPRLHRSIAWGLSQLCNWYGDKAYRQLDEWFTVIYGVALMVEETDADPNQLALDFTQIEEKE